RSSSTPGGHGGPPLQYVPRYSKTSRGGAFFDLGPGVAKADGSIEHQFVARISIDAVIPKSLKLIFRSLLRVSQTRLDHATVQHLQRIRIQVLGKIVPFFNLVWILLRKEIVVETNLCR